VLSIAIIGANGQVGKEVCLLLNRRAGVRVVAICRNELSAIFLEACGLECRIGKISVAQEAEYLLNGADLVADFSLPRGSQSDIRHQLSTIIDNSIRYSPRNARFVYISSLMARGDPDDGFRWRFLAGTAYGASKRYAEKKARRAARRADHELYVLRLGQVHGELQAVGSGIAHELKSYSSVSVSRGPSCAVFVTTIADVLVNIASGKERPGTYSVVENPPWTWKQVYDLYSGRTNSQCSVKEFTLPRQNAVSLFRTFLDRFAIRNRDIARWYLGMLPQLERKLKARHYSGLARAEIGNLLSRTDHRPICIRKPYVGGKRLQSLNRYHHPISQTVGAVTPLVDRFAPSKD
jgi:nucleoside-diphosphate-sugar epimerase